MLATFFVEAGSSMDLNIDGITRLAPTRKEIVLDAQSDICAFFVPMRHIYGQAWIDFINGGPDAVAAFTGVTIGAGYQDADFLGVPNTGATLNRALLETYNRIYANYYARQDFPLTPDAGAANTTDFDWFPTTETGAANCRKFGRLAARLPHIFNMGVQVDAGGTTGWEAQSLTDADAEVSVTAGVWDIRNMALVQSRYRTEAESAWFAHFYQDVMKERFGSELGPEVDPRNQRPTMLGRSTQMLSGMEVDGTDDATLGTVQGKTLGRTGFNMPRKFFGEHGIVMVLQLLRYPLINLYEIHPLFKIFNYTFDQICGDPQRFSNLAPESFDPSIYSYSGGPTPTEAIQVPYGNWLRTQVNRTHSVYRDIPGYPFTGNVGTDFLNYIYHTNEEYTNTFQTNQIGQWQGQYKVVANKYSLVPPPASSIFAGT